MKNFSNKAERIWSKIPPDIQKRLLTNVYCAQCGGVTTITDYTGRIVNGDLILKGSCVRCGNPVTRLIEGND